MAKQQSLARQTGTLAVGNFTLPSVFSAPTEPLVSRFQTPYITFAHPKRSDEWSKIIAVDSNAQESDMFLMLPTGPLPLPVAKLGLVCCRQYWGEANPAGEILRTSFQEQPRPFKEHVEAVVLVYMENQIVPANVCFRTTKCQAAKALSDALIESASPDWASKSPEHRETLVLEQPFFRFIGLVTLGPRRTSKSSGLAYRPTACKIQPTSVPEWRLIKEFCESSGTQKKLDDVANRFQDRLAEVAKKLIAA